MEQKHHKNRENLYIFIYVAVVLTIIILLVVFNNLRFTDEKTGLSFKREWSSYTVSVGDAKEKAVIVIPEKFRGLPVTAIADDGFAECRNLKEIILPSSIQIIGYEAFFLCSALEHINLPDSITTIYRHAFYGCTSLKELNLPGSMKTVAGESQSLFTFGAPTFSFVTNCSNLEKITVSEGTENVNFDSFSYADAENFKTIVLPHSVKELYNFLDFALALKSNRIEIIYNGTSSEFEAIEKSDINMLSKYLDSVTVRCTDNDIIIK